MASCDSTVHVSAAATAAAAAVLDSVGGNDGVVVVHVVIFVPCTMVFSAVTLGW